MTNDQDQQTQDPKSEDKPGTAWLQAALLPGFARALGPENNVNVNVGRDSKWKTFHVFCAALY